MTKILNWRFEREADGVILIVNLFASLFDDLCVESDSCS